MNNREVYKIMSIGTKALATVSVVAVTALIFVIAWAVITIIGQWKLFEKCGEKGWKSLIPFYNDWTIVGISGCKWWYFFFIISESVLTATVENIETLASLSLVSSVLGIISIYIILCINYNIARKFHQGIGFAVGMTLVPFVFYLILGFSDKYKYDKNVNVNSWGIYDFETKTSELRTEKNYCTNCGTEMSSNFCPKCGKSKKGD